MLALEVELGGKDAVALAVAGEEGDLAAFEGAEGEDFAGVAEGGFDAVFRDVGEAVHVVEPAAADDADFCLRQTCLLPGRWGLGAP